MLPYQTRVDGNNIVVTLGEAARAARPPAARRRARDGRHGRAGAARAAAPSRTSTSAAATDGTGRVIVQAHRSAHADQPAPAGQPDPRRLRRRRPAEEPAAPLRRRRLRHAGAAASTRCATATARAWCITAAGDFEQLAYQTDDQYVDRGAAAPRKATAQADEKPVYTGERISAQLPGHRDARACCSSSPTPAARTSSSPTRSTGSVTLRLQNVPWDQALDIVLRTKGLDKRVQDNVIIVAPGRRARQPREGRARRHARTSRNWRRCAPSTCRSTTPRPRTSPR